MESNETVYWSRLEGHAEPLHLAATISGLCYVGSAGKPLDELEAWARSRIPGARLERDDERLRSYAQQLSAYMSGAGKMSFDMPLDLRGTPFQLAVWAALRRVEPGTTCAYSELAAVLNRPDAVRAVAAAIGANPLLIVIPCHRVIGKNGALTGYRGGLAMKEALLRIEQQST